MQCFSLKSNTVTDKVLIDKAKWVAIVEKASEPGPTKEKDVCFALMDLFDYAFEKDISITDFPEDIDEILKDTYTYLNRPFEGE